MALQSPLSGSAISVSNSPNFIPKLWQSEVKRELDANLTMKMAVQMVPHQGKSGDTMIYPLIRRMGVNDKISNTPVVLQSFPDDKWELKIDRYKEASFLIESIIETQSAYPLRREYTREAGYALAVDCDNAILALRASVPTSQQIVVSSTNTIAGNPESINEAAVLAAIQLLNEANVPQNDRVLFVGVGQYTDLLNITKFTSKDFVDGNPISDGFIGRLYGVPVMQTTQIGLNSLLGLSNGFGTPLTPTPGVAGSNYLPTQDSVVGFASGLPRGKTGSEVSLPFVTCMMVQKGWAKFAVQKALSSTASWENLYQAHAIVNTHIYGTRVYRPDHCVLIHTAP